MNDALKPRRKRRTLKRRVGLIVLAIVGLLLFGPVHVHVGRTVEWWTAESMVPADPIPEDRVLRGESVLVLTLDGHASDSGVAALLIAYLEERWPEAEIERARAPYVSEGPLPDVIALVDRVHSDERYLGLYAHQMLRLNVSLGATPRASELARPAGVRRPELEYSIDGHADTFGVVSRGARWRPPVATVAADLRELLTGRAELGPSLGSDAVSRDDADSALALPFEFTGELAGEVQELYRGVRSNGHLERQWQLATEGSGVAAVEAIRDAALAAGWIEVGANFRVDRRPRSLALRKDTDWLHVRQAYMEGIVRDDADAPQVLALIRWRE